MEIRTDSTYAMNAIQHFAPKWRENEDENGNWYNSKGKMISIYTKYCEDLP